MPKQVGMTGTIDAPGKALKPPMLLTQQASAAEGGTASGLAAFRWVPALSSDKAEGGEAVGARPFTVASVRTLREAGHDLIVTGACWTAVAAGGAHPGPPPPPSSSTSTSPSPLPRRLRAVPALATG